MTAINELLDRYKRGERVTIEINKIVDTLNVRVRKMVDEGTSHFYKLADLLKDVLSDHKSANPTFVSNIRIIGGEGNRDFVAVLRRCHNDIVKFVRIMKNFAVIDAEAFVQTKHDNTRD